MKKCIWLTLALLPVLLTACSGKPKLFTGEISDLRLDADGGIASFAVTAEDGKKRGFLTAERTWSTSWVDGISSPEEFLLRQLPETQVSVQYTSGRTSLTTASGERLPAYTADVIIICGILSPDAASLSDGTPLDIFQQSGSLTYRLPDGTDLLCVRELPGAEQDYVAGWNTLNETAQARVSAYYQERGLLYSLEDELERAYANMQDLDLRRSPPAVWQEILPAVSASRIMYARTEVSLPVYGEGDATNTMVQLCDAFDRETGERINGWDLFTCPPGEAVQALLDLAQITEQPLRSEAEAAFRPEYMLFYPSMLEVFFPQGALPSQDMSLGFGLDYNDGLRAILQDWALPE